MRYYIDVFTGENQSYINTFTVDSDKISIVKKDRDKILFEGKGDAGDYLLAILMTGNINLQEEFCLIYMDICEELEGLNDWIKPNEIFDNTEERPAVLSLTEIRYAEFLLVFS